MPYPSMRNFRVCVQADSSFMGFLWSICKQAWYPPYLLYVSMERFRKLCMPKGGRLLACISPMNLKTLTIPRCCLFTLPHHHLSPTPFFSWFLLIGISSKTVTTSYEHRSSKCYFGPFCRCSAFRGGSPPGKAQNIHTALPGGLGGGGAQFTHDGTPNQSPPEVVGGALVGRY